MKTIRFLILAGLLAAVLVSSCGPSGEMNLEGTAWELTSLAGAPLIPGTRITLTFDSQELGGNAGCNQYFGSYALNSAGGLQVNGIGMTEMACLDPEGVMQQETAYASALGSAVKAVRRGSQLILQDAAGQEILVFSPALE